jgi:hypothetical protein
MLDALYIIALMVLVVAIIATAQWLRHRREREIYRRWWRRE